MNTRSIPQKPCTVLPSAQVPPRAIATPPPGATLASSSSRDENTTRFSRTLEKQFAERAADPERFHELMRGVYGEGYDRGKAEQLRNQALAGDFSWMPPVRLLPADALHGANGAYDAASGTVYLNAELAARDPELAASTYVEEAGAHLDTLLNRSDSIGDEGELFRRVMAGEKLSAEQVHEIQAEDDHGTIQVDGREVAVEFWNPLKAIRNVAKDIGGVFKRLGTEVKDAVKDVGSELKAGWDRMNKAGSEVWGTFAGGVKGMTYSFVKNLFKGKFGEAFVTLFNGFEKVVFGMPRKVAGMIVDGARDLCKSFTHLLPEFLGKHVRTGLDKLTEGLNFVGRFFLSMGLRPYRAVTRPVGEFIAQTERTVRMAIDGKHREGFREFIETFKNLPKRAWEELNAPIDETESEIVQE